MDPPTPDARTLSLHLELQPRTAHGAWHAVLEDTVSGERLEFETPLALLQHLDGLAQQLGGTVIGIR